MSSSPRSASLPLILTVLLFFCVGFTVFFGREAASAGSWKYIITHLDGFQYWGMADGASESPSSEANPFYYEERGKANSFPYPLVSLTGKAARLLNVPVLAFLPFWQIGMPFLIWLISTWAVCRFFNKSFFPAALFVLALIVLTLFLRGAASFIFFRFSRPADGLFLMIPWLCWLARRRDVKTGIPALFQWAPLALVWFHPVYLLPGFLMIACEILFTLRTRKTGSGLLRQAFILAAACLAYGAYVYLRSGENNWLIQHIAVDRGHALEHSMSGTHATRRPDLLSLSCWTLWAGFVLLRRRLQPGRTDLLLLALLAVDPALANVQIFLGANYQAELHRYYFLFPQMLILFCWIHRESTRLPAPLVRLFGIAGAGAAVAMIQSPAWNFLLAFPMDTPFFFSFNQTRLLLALTALAWTLAAAARIIRVRPGLLLSVILTAGLAGFALRPSEMRLSNRAYPFEQSHSWLRQHAEPGDVVLNLSPARRWNQDYLIFYTPLRNYYHPYFGHVHARDKEANNYRSIFYNLLLLGKLDTVPIGEITTLKDKLQHLRLNYILTDLPSPFILRVERQLEGFIERVYEDERSLLWKVKVPA